MGLRGDHIMRKIYILIFSVILSVMLCLSSDNDIKCMAAEQKLNTEKILTSQQNLTAEKIMDTQQNLNADNIENDVLPDYKELYDKYVDVDGIGSELSDVNNEYGMSTDISFEDIYELLINGNVDGAVDKCVELIGKSITAEILENRSLLIRLMLLILIAAVFNNYSSVLKHSYVGEQGFFITYLMACAILMRSFFLIYDMAENAVMHISEAMQCMLPAFAMSLIMSSGIATSQMTNSVFLLIFAMMEKLLLYGVFPLIRIFFLIVLLNQLNGKDRFSKLSELIKHIAEWVLKGMLALVVGLNAVKTMLIPVYESVKYDILKKGLSLIPGVGQVSGLSGIFIGAGILIKNCVGITAVIILVVIGSIPVLKLIYFYISYRLVVAAIQPISDKRLLSGVLGACDATEVLIKTVLTSLALCVISISIIIVSTNSRL